MDASDDSDIQLQRASSDLLVEFEDSLLKFLWSSKSGQTRRIRKYARESTTKDLIKLLQPFQEWPQLLDPRLASFMHVFVDAYLEYVEKYLGEDTKKTRKVTEEFVPLSQAMSRIIYTLCKVRGVKVITRFLSNEPRYLEPLLEAFKVWSQDSDTEVMGEGVHSMIWEERYVLLSWLSHLMLTPFDLSSISSTESIETQLPQPSLRLPSGLPSITVRLVQICTNYMIIAGKEREASVSLLVRLTIRPDMHRAGLFDAMMHWALSSLVSTDRSPKSIYEHVGILSFVAGVVSSAEAAILSPHHLRIFQCIQKINADATRISKDISSSALARKIIIKIHRALTIVLLQSETLHPSLAVADMVDVVLEEAIEYLLNALADKDTPVRFAASKALSTISVKLQPAMAAEVVQAITNGLEENVIWEKSQVNSLAEELLPQSLQTRSIEERSLSAVNALRWQGLTLTLSHLLFRRCPPPSQLPIILNALILSLGFEQRSSAGSSFGTNVRDAACFGIWSLARRYTTSELDLVDTSTIRAIQDQEGQISVLQILANELVLAATIDPSGNIRRGASAALQELIGRHPNTVNHGISIVQVVDYHAVALRSKAMEVAISASKLDVRYWKALVDGLLGWRGLAAPDADSRRMAATTIGRLVSYQKSEGIRWTMDRVCENLGNLRSGDIEKRHGLLLGVSAIIQECQPTMEESSGKGRLSEARLWSIFKPSFLLDDKDFTSHVLRPALTAEAACTLISRLTSNGLNRGEQPPTPPLEILLRCVRFVSLSLARVEETVVVCASEAAQSLFRILDEVTKQQLINSWIAKLDIEANFGRHGSADVFGYLAALSAIFAMYQHVDEVRGAILNIFVDQLVAETDIETKVAALKSLSIGILPCKVMTQSVSNAIWLSLDDYTIDQRGDIGSLVRIEAINAVHTACQHDLLDEVTTRVLLSKVCGLAVEKLDRVRFRAWRCLKDNWVLFATRSLPWECNDVADTSSVEYYLQMLSLASLEWVRLPLMEGFMTSAGGGSESVLRSARAALSTHVMSLDGDSLKDFYDVLVNLLKVKPPKERLLVPLLEVLAFLFEIEVFDQFKNVTYNWQSLFGAVQRAHYKSTIIPKLKAAIDVYIGLASAESIRQDVLLKLLGLLLHPFPQVRSAAAEALYILTRESKVSAVDWTRPPKSLKGEVTSVQSILEARTSVP